MEKCYDVEEITNPTGNSAYFFFNFYNCHQNSRENKSWVNAF